MHIVLLLSLINRFGYHLQDDVSRDALEIEGWDSVDVLCQHLMHIQGMSLSPAEARRIEKLYNDLPEYDKKPLRYSLNVPKNLDGIFARSKCKSHITIDTMKR